VHKKKKKLTLKEAEKITGPLELWGVGKTEKEITDTVPFVAGLGIFKSVFNSWNSIENFAKAHGIYSPMELRELIFKNSPIAKVGDQNLEIARIIDEDRNKNKGKSLHAAVLDNFRELCICIKINPNTVHMGANWMQIQKKKDKRLQNKKFADKMYPKDYIQIIKTINSRYTRLMKSSKHVYKKWAIQNKKNRDNINFINYCLKDLDQQHKKLNKR
tara:strand:- start:89 stop:736 length:648 start_codon:yes stop_codon:yes gene_type:complete